MHEGYLSHHMDIRVWYLGPLQVHFPEYGLFLYRNMWYGWRENIYTV